MSRQDLSMHESASARPMAGDVPSAAPLTASGSGGRVLMLCYTFPPIVIAGSIRSAAFAARLPAFGWHPTVLTVKNARDLALQVRDRQAVDATTTVVRTAEWNLSGAVALAQGVVNRPFKIAGRPLTRNYFREWLCIPDEQIAWWSTVAGARLSQHCDVIYASCSPFSSALSGAWIKRLTGKPLVLDFRDAWSLNSHAHWSPYQRWWIEHIERFVVRTCDRLILNTWSAERAYRQLYPDYAEKCLTIPNGYDTLTPAAGDRSSGVFRIVHVGNFYGNRSPTALLRALAALARDDVEFVHVGTANEELLSVRGARVTCIPPVSHEKALEIMRGASLLYLKQGHEPGVSTYLAVASKTYEYLATGLPILADCPESDNAELVRQHASRAYVVTSGLAQDVAQALERAYAERMDVVPQISPAFERDFGRTMLTARLAQVLSTVSAEARR